MWTNELLLAPLKLLTIILVAYFISACGGGTESTSQDTVISLPNPGPTPTPTPTPTPVIPNSMLVHCTDKNANPLAAFTNVTVEVGLCYTPSVTDLDSSTSRLAGGIAVSDYNNDGLLDIYVTHGRNGRGRLFKQNSNKQFNDVTEQAGIIISSIDRGAVFVDVNHDGRSDLMSVQDGFPFIYIFANNGNGSFTDVTESIGIKLTKPAFSVAAGDYDLDGDLDLFFAHWLTDRNDNPNEFLWTNQGDATYVDNSNIVDIRPIKGTFLAIDRDAEIEYSFTPIFADINNDRYPDMLLTGDFNSTQLLVNNNGTEFVDRTSDVFTDTAGMGAAVADYDNDGDLDWFVSAIGDPIAKSLANAAYSGNRFYKNDGYGYFTDVTDEAGVRQGHWGWGSCFADFNNDGHLDLFIVNGYDGLTTQDSEKEIFAIFNEDPALLYINNGDQTFTDRATELGVLHTKMARGLVCYDYDRDGDQDMVIANNGGAPTLYQNNTFSNGNNFLNIVLDGTVDNHQGVGARIYITIAGQERMTELQLGNQYLSQNPVEAHFGLGKATQVDRLTVVWPGLEVITTELSDVQANQFLSIPHPNN
jgi:hypothetical protein